MHNNNNINCETAAFTFLFPKTIMGNKNAKWYSTNDFESHFPIQRNTRNTANESRQHDVLKLSCVTKQQNL